MPKRLVNIFIFKLILIWISIVIDNKNKWKQLIWVSNQLRARSTVNNLGHVYFHQSRYRKPLNVLVSYEQREKIEAVLPPGELMIYKLPIFTHKCYTDLSASHMGWLRSTIYRVFIIKSQTVDLLVATTAGVFSLQPSVDWNARPVLLEQCSVFSLVSCCRVWENKAHVSSTDHVECPVVWREVWGGRVGVRRPVAPAGGPRGEWRRRTHWRRRVTAVATHALVCGVDL